MTANESSAAASRRALQSRAAAQVREFNRAFGLPVATKPSLAHVTQDQLDMRLSLLQEEVEEFGEAISVRSMVGMADALADIVYVAYGAALTIGIDLDLVLDEVHSSNMTKLDSQGQPIRRSDGKVLKSDCYRPPNIAELIDSQSDV